jgi:hypothetical protein
MPKPREIVKKITKEARRQKRVFTFDREGANHTVYRLDGVIIPIPRHREIDNQMAETIYRECADKLGEGWWRK